MKAFAFYINYGPDHRGRTLNQILAWDDEALEHQHDYIQWLFPLTEPSGANPDAPLLTFAEMELFRESEPARARFVEAFERMLEFYGLRLVREESGLLVERTDNFEKRARNWLNPGNHNHLRITRILTSLRLVGLSQYSKAFFRCLEVIYQEHRNRITETTFGFWQRAVREEG